MLLFLINGCVLHIKCVVLKDLERGRNVENAIDELGICIIVLELLQKLDVGRPKLGLRLLQSAVKYCLDFGLVIEEVDHFVCLFAQSNIKCEGNHN